MLSYKKIIKVRVCHCCMDIFRRLFRTNRPVGNFTGILEVRTEHRREKNSEEVDRLLGQT